MSLYDRHGRLIRVLRYLGVGMIVASTVALDAMTVAQLVGGGAPSHGGATNMGGWSSALLLLPLNLVAAALLWLLWAARGGRG